MIQNNNKLLVDGDIEVTVSKIMQWHTYEGMLEGLPNRKLNRDLLESLERKLKDFCGLDQVYIIEPLEKPFTADSPYFRGDPAMLPMVTCMAEIFTYHSFRDQTREFSMMGIAWFQDQFAFPVDQNVVDIIKAIPYRELCGEFGFGVSVVG
jgi:hypothetical protein